MTREELEKTHPDYRANIGRWRYFLNSYYGGSLYRDGNYLLQHPFESSANYRRRKETSYYYNYCGPIVDILVSHLFRKDAVREYGGIAQDPIFRAFQKDADMQGNSFRHFMREAQRLASIYGRVSIIVDKPRVATATRAEAMEQGIYPYVALVTPENLVDWSFVRLSTGRVVMDMAKIKEGDDTYRIWGRDGWELWDMTKDSPEPSLIDVSGHDIGAVPLVNLYNKQTGVAMHGISDLQDIADINRNIYYLCSDAREIIENTAFPMLAIPYTRSAGREEKEVGPHNILQFDPEAPNSKPYWLEAPHSSLSEIREWVRQDIGEIYRIARMGGVRATEDNPAPRSGVALEQENQQLYSTLSEKADNIEQAENSILSLWARWEGMEFDGRIDYPDDFSVKDLERDIKSAIEALSASVGSKTFKREVQKKIAQSVLQKIDEETKAKIIGEIDAEAP
jgi:hypothetical protein